MSTDYLITENSDVDLSTSNTVTASTLSADDIKKESIKSRHHKATVIIGVLFAFLGLCGVLIFWVASIINPVVAQNSQGIFSGLNAFLLAHNATGLFICCCVVGVVGLIIIFYPFLKAFFEPDERVSKEIEQIKEELVKEVIEKEMEGMRTAVRRYKK